MATRTPWDSFTGGQRFPNPIDMGDGRLWIGYNYTPIFEKKKPKRMEPWPSNGHYVNATCAKCKTEERCHYRVSYRELLTMYGVKSEEQRFPPICRTCFVEENN